MSTYNDLYQLISREGRLPEVEFNHYAEHFGVVVNDRFAILYRLFNREDTSITDLLDGNLLNRQGILDSLYIAYLVGNLKDLKPFMLLLPPTVETVCWQSSKKFKFHYSPINRLYR